MMSTSPWHRPLEGVLPLHLVKQCSSDSKTVNDGLDVNDQNIILQVSGQRQENSLGSEVIFIGYFSPAAKIWISPETATREGEWERRQIVFNDLTSSEGLIGRGGALCFPIFEDGKIILARHQWSGLARIMIGSMQVDLSLFAHSTDAIIIDFEDKAYRVISGQDIAIYRQEIKKQEPDVFEVSGIQTIHTITQTRAHNLSPVGVGKFGSDNNQIINADNATYTINIYHHDNVFFNGLRYALFGLEGSRLHNVWWEPSLFSEPELAPVELRPFIASYDIVTEDVFILSFTNLAGYFYHWLVDMLPKFKLKSFLPANVKYIVMLDNEHSFHRQSLIALDDTVEFLNPRDRPKLFKSAYFSDETLEDYAVSFFRSGYFSNLKTSTKLNRRLYVSRSRASVRRVLNENEVLSVLEPLGFQVVFAENLDFISKNDFGMESKTGGQVDIFSSAEIVIGPHGGGLTNILFMPKDSTLIEFSIPSYFNKSLSGNGYWRLANACGIRYRFLEAREMIHAGSQLCDGDMIVDIQLLKTLLAEVLIAPDSRLV